MDVLIGKDLLNEILSVLESEQDNRFCSTTQNLIDHARSLLGDDTHVFNRVKALKDESGHWYVIPIDRVDEFEADLFAPEDFDFGARWGKYATGGDLNIVPMYAALNHSSPCSNG